MRRWEEAKAGSGGKKPRPAAPEQKVEGTWGWSGPGEGVRSAQVGRARTNTPVSLSAALSQDPSGRPSRGACPDGVWPCFHSEPQFLKPAPKPLVLARALKGLGILKLIYLQGN